MTPQEVLQLYVSLKLHFTSPKYDAILYNYKTKNIPIFSKRNDKHFFVRLSRHRDPKNLLIANLSYKPSMWIGELFNAESEERFKKMLGRWDAILYNFEEDLKKIEYPGLLVNQHQHPELIKMYFQKKISLETLIILDDLLGFYNYWNEELTDPIWKSMSLIILKYRPFLKYDKEKAKNILDKKWARV